MNVQISEKPSLSASSWRPSLFQVAAQNHVYHRLVAATIKTFLVVLLIPPMLSCTGVFMSLLTKQMILPAAILSIVFIIVAGKLAVKLSTSEKALDGWLRESSGRVPIYAFFLSCLIARLFGSPPTWNDLWSASSFLQICWEAQRLALTAVVLQVTLMLRYISPVSLYRLSTVPLKMNQPESLARKLLLEPMSIVEPNDFSERNPSWNSSFDGRRFIRPPIRSYLVHAALLLIVGMLSSVTIGAYVSTMDDQSLSLAIACGLTAASTIPLPPFHEMDYRMYQSFERVFWTSKSYLGLAVRAFLMPVLLLAGAFLSGNAQVDPLQELMSFVHLSQACAAMVLGIHLLEGYIQLILFAPFDVAHAVDQICPQPNASARLHAIILGLVNDSDIASNIQVTRREDERREQRLCAELSTALAPRFLAMPEGYVETPFEEDIFRMAILEAVSGSRSSLANKWLAPHQGRKDPLVRHLLVKGLCVLLGGAGEALCLVSFPKDEGWENRASPSKVNFCSLGQGFFTSLEFALTALSGFITEDFKADGPVRDWKGYDVAFMVPAALQAVFVLRKGLLRYQKCHLGEIFASGATVAATTSLIDSCDHTVKSIVACLKSPHANDDTLSDLLLDDDCRLWIKNFAKKPSHSNRLT